MAEEIQELIEQADGEFDELIGRLKGLPEEKKVKPNIGDFFKPVEAVPFDVMITNLPRGEAPSDLPKTHIDDFDMEELAKLPEADEKQNELIATATDTQKGIDLYNKTKMAFADSDGMPVSDIAFSVINAVRGGEETTVVDVPDVTWDEVKTSPEWASKSVAQKEFARDNWFEKVVVPKALEAGLTGSDIQGLAWEHLRLSADDIRPTTYGTPVRQGLKQAVDFSIGGFYRTVGVLTDMLPDRGVFLHDYVFTNTQDRLRNKLEEVRLAEESGEKKVLVEQKNPFLETATQIEQGTQDFFKPIPPTGRAAERIKDPMELLDPKRFWQLLATGGPTTISMIGATLVNPAFGTAMMISGETGNISKMLTEIEEAEGTTMNPIKKAAISVGFGAFNGILERLGLDKMISVTASRTMRDVMVRGMTALATEELTEGLQGGNEKVAEVIGSTLQEFNFGEYTDEVYQSMLEAAPVTAAFVGTGVGASVARSPKFKQYITDDEGYIDFNFQDRSKQKPTDAQKTTLNGLMFVGKGIKRPVNLEGIKNIEDMSRKEADLAINDLMHQVKYQKQAMEDLEEMDETLKEREKRQQEEGTEVLRYRYMRSARNAQEAGTLVEIVPINQEVYEDYIEEYMDDMSYVDFLGTHPDKTHVELFSTEGIYEFEPAIDEKFDEDGNSVGKFPVMGNQVSLDPIREAKIFGLDPRIIIPVSSFNSPESMRQGAFADEALPKQPNTEFQPNEETDEVVNILQHATLPEIDMEIEHLKQIASMDEVDVNTITKNITGFDSYQRLSQDLKLRVKQELWSGLGRTPQMIEKYPVLNTFNGVETAWINDYDVNGATNTNLYSLYLISNIKQRIIETDGNSTAINDKDVNTWVKELDRHRTPTIDNLLETAKNRFVEQIKNINKPVYEINEAHQADIEAKAAIAKVNSNANRIMDLAKDYTSLAEQAVAAEKVDLPELTKKLRKIDSTKKMVMDVQRSLQKRADRLSKRVKLIDVERAIKGIDIMKPGGLTQYMRAISKYFKQDGGYLGFDDMSAPKDPDYDGGDMQFNGIQETGDVSMQPFSLWTVINPNHEFHGSTLGLEIMINSGLKLPRLNNEEVDSLNPEEQKMYKDALKAQDEGTQREEAPVEDLTEEEYRDYVNDMNVKQKEYSEDDTTVDDGNQAHSTAAEFITKNSSADYLDVADENWMDKFLRAVTLRDFRRPVKNINVYPSGKNLMSYVSDVHTDVGTIAGKPLRWMEDAARKLGKERGPIKNMFDIASVVPAEKDWVKVNFKKWYEDPDGAETGSEVWEEKDINGDVIKRHIITSNIKNFEQQYRQMKGYFKDLTDKYGIGVRTYKPINEVMNFNDGRVRAVYNDYLVTIGKRRLSFNEMRDINVESLTKVTVPNISDDVKTGIERIQDEFAENFPNATHEEHMQLIDLHPERDFINANTVAYNKYKYAKQLNTRLEKSLKLRKLKHIEGTAYQVPLLLSGPTAITNHFTHMLSYEAKLAINTKEGPTWDAIKKWSDDNNVDPDLLRDMADPMRAPVDRQFGSIEEARKNELPDIIPGTGIQFLETDVFKEMTWYIHNAARRISAVRVIKEQPGYGVNEFSVPWGDKDHYDYSAAIENFFKDNRQGLIDEGAGTRNVVTAKAVWDASLGMTPGFPPHISERLPYSALMSGEDIARGLVLSGGFITNAVGGHFPIMANVGVYKWAKAMLQVPAAKFGNQAAQDKLTLTRDMLGWSLNNMDLMTETNGLRQKTGKIAKKTLEITLFNWINRQLNKGASIAGLDYANDSADILTSGKKGQVKFKKFELVKTFGFTNEEVDTIIDTGTFTDRQRPRIVQEIVAQANIFRENPKNVPPWMKTELGSRVMSLQSFTRNMGNLLADGLSEASAGNFRKLTTFLLGGVASEVAIRLVREAVEDRWERRAQEFIAPPIEGGVDFFLESFSEGPVSAVQGVADDMFDDPEWWSTLFTTVLGSTVAGLWGSVANDMIYTWRFDKSSPNFESILIPPQLDFGVQLTWSMGRALINSATELEISEEDFEKIVDKVPGLRPLRGGYQKIVDGEWRIID